MSRRYYARPVRPDRPGGPWEVADRMTGTASAGTPRRTPPGSRPPA